MSVDINVTSAMPELFPNHILTPLSLPLCIDMEWKLMLLCAYAKCADETFFELIRKRSVLFYIQTAYRTT
jgi:hypothetical protein